LPALPATGEIAAVHGRGAAAAPPLHPPATRALRA